MSARPHGVSPPKSAATSRAGFVRAAGRSSRMGCDKVLRETRALSSSGLADSTLIEQLAGRVRQAGKVTVIAAAVTGQMEGCGLLGGLVTAESVILSKEFKMQEFVSRIWPAREAALFRNVHAPDNAPESAPENTPEDWRLETEAR